MKLNQVVDRVPRCVVLVQRELIRMWSREPRLDLDPNKIMGLRYPSVTKSLPIAEGSRTSLEPSLKPDVLSVWYKRSYCRPSAGSAESELDYRKYLGPYRFIYLSICYS